MTTEYHKATEFTVELETWMRGEGDACLLTDDGRRCCLGFWARECGATDDDLIPLDLPSELFSDMSEWLRWSDGEVWHGEAEIADTNDDENIGDYSRMRALRELFLARGIAVRFTKYGKEIDLGGR